MNITASFGSRYHGRVTVRGDRNPPEPDAGIRHPHWEITESFDEEGQEIALSHRDFCLASEALECAYNELRWDEDTESSIDPDCGFDPYLGSYSDDC